MHATRLANQEKLGGIKVEMKAEYFTKTSQINAESANDEIRSRQFFKLVLPSLRNNYFNTIIFDFSPYLLIMVQ